MQTLVLTLFAVLLTGTGLDGAANEARAQPAPGVPPLQLKVTLDRSEGAYLIRARFKQEPGRKEIALTGDLVGPLLQSRKINERGVTISPPFVDEHAVLLTVVPKSRKTEDGLDVQLPALTFAAVELVSVDGAVIVFRLTFSEEAGKTSLVHGSLKEESELLVVPLAKQIATLLGDRYPGRSDTLTAYLRQLPRQGRWIELQVRPEVSKEELYREYSLMRDEQRKLFSLAERVFFGK